MKYLIYFLVILTGFIVPAEAKFLLGGAALAGTPLRVATVQNRSGSGHQTNTGLTTEAFRWGEVIGTNLSDIVISFNGWYQNSSSVSNNGNDVSIIDCALESPGGTVVPIKFSGGRTATITDGVVDFQSDALSATAFGIASYARGDTYWVKCKLQISVDTSHIINTAASNEGGTQIVWYDQTVTTASSTDTAGAYTVVSGPAFSTKTSGYQPIVLGHPVIDGKSFIFTGDSICADLNDGSLGAAALGGKAFFQRSMHDANALTNPIPSINFCRDSSQSTLLLNNTQWKTYIQYAKYAADEYGHNDFALGSVSAATLESRLQTLWGLLRTGGVTKILRVDLTPGTQSNLEFASFTIGSGGSSYGNTQTFTATLSGGSLAGGGSAAQASVTSNSSGVITTINSVVTPGLYTTLPTLPTSTTGGAGSGLTLDSPFSTGNGGWFDNGNQSTSGAFVPRGDAATVNSWFDTEVSNNTIDAAVHFSLIRDGSNAEKWFSNGTVNYITADGTHPQPVGHEDCASEIRPVIAASFP